MNRAHKLFGWLVLVVIAWLLSGCSLVAPYENRTTRTVERTWLAMDAIDTYQTVNFAPCTREADPAAAWLYGSDRPSDARVIATNAVLGYAHYRIGGWIDKRTEAAAIDPEDASYGGWYLFRAAWHGFALIGTGFSVLHNAASRYECP